MYICICMYSQDTYICMYVYIYIYIHTPYTKTLHMYSCLNRNFQVPTPGDDETLPWPNFRGPIPGQPLGEINMYVCICMYVYRVSILPYLQSSFLIIR